MEARPRVRRLLYNRKMMVTRLSGCSGNRDRAVDLRIETAGLADGLDADGLGLMEKFILKMSPRYVYNQDLYKNSSPFNIRMCS